MQDEAKEYGEAGSARGGAKAGGEGAGDESLRPLWDVMSELRIIDAMEFFSYNNFPMDTFSPKEQPVPREEISTEGNDEIVRGRTQQTLLMLKELGIEIDETHLERLRSDKSRAGLVTEIMKTDRLWRYFPPTSSGF